MKTPNLSDKLVRLHLRSQESQSKLQQIHLDQKQLLRKTWENLSNAFAQNLKAQSYIPIVDLIGQSVCTALGIAFNPKIFPKSKNLEYIGQFFETFGKTGVEMLDRYLTLTQHEAPRHRLEFQERAAEIDHSQVQDLQRQMDQVVDKTLDLIRLHLSTEKSIIES